MKREFWTGFAETYPRKWLLYDTKIKDFALKFDADRRTASVMIEVSHRDRETRIRYFEKLESLKSLLLQDYLPDAVYSSGIVLESGKEVSRVSVVLEGVSLSNRATWPSIYDFFSEKMTALELFFYEFEDFIKDV